MIMSTKATVDSVINPGDLVKLYVKKGHESWGKWMSPLIVQIVDKSAGTVSVPDSPGHNIIASLEDVRMAITEDALATKIIGSIGKN